jgi:hypothetical protein
MDPEERKKLLEKLEVAKARKAELDDQKKDLLGRAAAVSRESKKAQLLRFETSVKNQLYDYGGEYGCIVRFRTLQQRILDSSEYRTVFKRPSCFDLVKEYCAADAVGTAAVGMAAAAADDDAAAVAVGAAVSIIDRIEQRFSESKTILRERLENENQDTIDRYKRFYKIQILGLKTLSETTIEKEFLLLDPIEKAIESKHITEEKANEMLCGNLDTIRRNREKSVLLSVCQTQLTPQLPSSKESKFSANLLDACFLWDGVPLELPDRLDVLRERLGAQAPPQQLQAQAPPQQLQAQPPHVSGVFIKTKSTFVPSLTQQERFVTIDENGFNWFNKNTKEQIGSIPLGRIVGASAAGIWSKLYGVEISHPGTEKNNTFLWCESLEEQKNIIETVNALVAALKKGGNKNRKTVIKYRKRRHQNKKKTHKKNANKKSTKKNIRKSKTKKNN